MNAKYKIAGTPIENLYEVFTTSEVNTATSTVGTGVTDSKFTDSANLFKVSGTGLKTAYSQTIPTSAGASYTGGANTCPQYKTGSIAINCALPGRRPIGLPLVPDIGPGTYYIKRANNITYYSTSASMDAQTLSADTQLSHSPQYVNIEIQAGGGGGGGGYSWGSAASGGAGGAYAFKIVEIPDNSYIRLVIGSGGERGGINANGSDGSSSYLYDSSGNVLMQAGGGSAGQRSSTSSTSGGSASGGDTNISGGSGGGRTNGGDAVGAFTSSLNKPEGGGLYHVTHSGGTSGGTNYGGGGGGSAFSTGANADTRSGDASDGSKGSGGSGACWRAAYSYRGGYGGDGIGNIYY